MRFLSNIEGMLTGKKPVVEVVPEEEALATAEATPETLEDDAKQVTTDLYAKAQPAIANEPGIAEDEAFTLVAGELKYAIYAPLTKDGPLQTADFKWQTTVFEDGARELRLFRLNIDPSSGKFDHHVTTVSRDILDGHFGGSFYEDPAFRPSTKPAEADRALFTRIRNDIKTGTLTTMFA